MSAKPNNKEFPGWAPPAAIAVWRERQASELDSVDSLRKLLSDDRCKTAWQAVERRGIDAGIVAMCCLISCNGPTGSETLSPVERAMWLSKVRKTALSLADLVEHSPLDNVLMNSYFGKLFGDLQDALLSKANQAREISAPVVDEDDIPPFFSDFLRYVASKAENIANDDDLLMARPGDSHANRAYFARQLTRLFREEIGREMRATVAAFTSVAFDCNLTEREITRLAP